ncbi:syntaxin-22 isoform X2 [Coffea arabica]|uniref:Syntaxin-22 isoform X2 n=1 Tax=Coffea arabica TaxID=13443 RepID=A0A6P6VK52_COFAR|nr:syntaxin-22-like isoform X2 [Coffea arabica]
MSFEDLEFGRSMTIRGDQTKQDCSRALAGDVFRIKTALAAFQRLVYNLGTPKDTPHLRHKLHTSVLQIGQLLEDASAKLKQSTQTHPHAPDAASKKIFDEKLAKEIAYIHREFQKAQRLAAERESAYAPLTPHQIVSYSDSPSEADMMKSMRSKEHTSLMIDTRSQDVINVESEIVLNEAIIEERDQGIKEIQQQIGEVNEIFKDLAVLVREQGAMIDDIDTNIEGSRDAIDQGTSQLTKASKIQRPNSSTCLVVVIFGIILLIVVVVVAA